MKIGNVEINLDFYDENITYSDGEIEEKLLKIVKENTEYESILKNSTEWPLLYHLHVDRENILNWYDFTGEEDVLEIGAGCGAITGLLSKKCRSVTCNDISLRRSEINAYKNAEHNNIMIYVGNFETVKFKKKFDVITLIGVLEYAESYINGAKGNPYEQMLSYIKTLLKPDGKLIIAIENKFGLKYWAGCKEDHTGLYYEGLEGYKNSSGVQTFSKRTLGELLKNSGFGTQAFYYPIPDYKFAYQIFSDKCLPEVGDLVNLIHNFDAERLVTFDEQAVYNQLIEEKMFPFFANSFLVIAKIDE